MQRNQEGGRGAHCAVPDTLPGRLPYSGAGTTPLEAAEIPFMDPDRWSALINNAAAHNNAVKLGKLKPSRNVLDGQAEFQATLLPMRRAAAHAGD